MNHIRHKIRSDGVIFFVDGPEIKLILRPTVKLSLIFVVNFYGNKYVEEFIGMRRFYDKQNFSIKKLTNHPVYLSSQVNLKQY